MLNTSITFQKSKRGIQVGERKAYSSTIISSTHYKAQFLEAKKAKEAKKGEQIARTRIQGCKGCCNWGRASV